MADEGFDRAMDGVAWSEVFERQRARGDLTQVYLELLELRRGQEVLDLGCGPGYGTIKLYERLRPGTVYAVDRRPGALRFLRERIEHGEGIHPIVGDVHAPPWRFSTPIRVVAAFLFHHLDAPRDAIPPLARALPPGSRVLVVEYDPEAAGDVGPPLDVRIGRTDCRAWLEEEGFEVSDVTTLQEEKYTVLGIRDKDST